MRLTSLLQTAIRQSLWDALLEYRMLSAPLALPNLSQNIMEAMEDTEVGQEDVKENPFLKQASNEGDGKEAGSLPEIVIEANELVDTPGGCLLDSFEEGLKGTLHPVYSSVVVKWFERGLELDSPSVFKHSVDLVASNSLPLVLKEIQNQITSIIPDLSCAMFQLQDQAYQPYTGGAVLRSEEFIIVSRNLEHWRLGTSEEGVDAGLMKTRAVKASQNFHPLILEPSSGEAEVLASASPPILGLLTPNTSVPLTPTTPALTTSGRRKILQKLKKMRMYSIYLSY